MTSIGLRLLAILVLFLLFSHSEGLTTSDCAAISSMAMPILPEGGCFEMINGTIGWDLGLVAAVRSINGDNDGKFVFCSERTLSLYFSILGGSYPSTKLNHSNVELQMIGSWNGSCANVSSQSDIVNAAPNLEGLNLLRADYLTALHYCSLLNVTSNLNGSYSAVLSNCGYADNSGIGTFSANKFLIKDALVSMTGLVLDSGNSSMTVCSWSGDCSTCVEEDNGCANLTSVLMAEGITKETELTNLNNTYNVNLAALSASQLSLNSTTEQLYLSISSIKNFSIAITGSPLMSAGNLTASINGISVLLNDINVLLGAGNGSILSKIVSIVALSNSTDEVVQSACSSGLESVICNSSSTHFDIKEATVKLSQMLVDILEEKRYADMKIADLEKEVEDLKNAAVVDPEVSSSDDSEFSVPLIIGLSVGCLAAVLAIIALAFSLKKGCKGRYGKFVADN